MFYTSELHISSVPITLAALLSSQYYQSGTLVSQLMKILISWAHFICDQQN